MNYSKYLPVEAELWDGVAIYGATNVSSSSMEDMAVWVAEAIKKIGSGATVEHYECTIPVVEKRAALPCNLVSSIWSIRIGKHYGRVSNADFRWDNTEGPCKISIQGSSINVGDTRSGESPVTEIEISYDGILCDERGIPMVRETHIVAIKWYIAWHLAILNREMNMMDRFERIWGQNCAQVRGEDNMLDPFTMDSLVPIWSSMIPADWRFKTGMEGM